MKEIVIIMGIQAAGKSTIVKHKRFSSCPARFNRDDMGGSLAKLNKKLEQAIIDGGERDEATFVLDNTYGTKDSRAEVIAIGKKYGIPVKCIWLKTKIEDAQYNASYRILKDHHFSLPASYSGVNELLGPNGNKLFKDIVPAIAIYAYRKQFEEPKIEEGFASIEKVEFVRAPLPSHYNEKAIFLDYDDTLRKTKSGDKYPKTPDDIEILPNRTEVLKQYAKEGYWLLGVSNQSGIEKGDLDYATAMDCFKRTNDLLGVSIDVMCCPHHSFPIRCYCRKPLPGLPVYFIEKYCLDPNQCIFVGDATSDKTCAKRSGIKFEWAKDFFK